MPRQTAGERLSDARLVTAARVHPNRLHARVVSAPRIHQLNVWAASGDTREIQRCEYTERLTTDPEPAR
jgi:hypothetical protein